MGDQPLCKQYTYFGDQHPFRHFCLLFSDCEQFSTDCSDCYTGVPICTICNFEDTLPDGTCGENSDTTTTPPTTTTSTTTTTATMTTTATITTTTTTTTITTTTTTTATTT